MTRFMRAYVKYVEAVNYVMGRIAMYMLFVMMGILLWSSISKTFFVPSIWTLEMAQFALVAYYLIGGPYSIQLGSNVRMDLVYGSWSARTKAWVDAFSVFALMFYLGVLLYGAVSSTAYSLGYFGSEPFGFFWELIKSFFADGTAGVKEKIGFLERSYSSWQPYMAPIKIVMTLGIFLMLLQAIAEFFKDIERIRGEEA